MSRPFSSSDAKKIIWEHQTLLAELSSIEKIVFETKSQIKRYSDAVVYWEVMKILRDIPVEEVNRDKLGIRVKTLRNNGYQTIADLSAASVYSLASIYGISQDGALTIKRITNDIVNKAMQGVKIRLSADNKTKEATQLVSTISVYRRILPIEERCRTILNNNKNDIEDAIRDIAASAGLFKWLFSSSTKKQKAIAAYQKLVSLHESAYWSESKQQIILSKNIQYVTESVAWKDFLKTLLPSSMFSKT